MTFEWYVSVYKYILDGMLLTKFAYVANFKLRGGVYVTVYRTEFYREWPIKDAGMYARSMYLQVVMNGLLK